MLPVSPRVSHKEQDLEQLLEVSRLTFICLQNKQTYEYKTIKGENIVCKGNEAGWDKHMDEQTLHSHSRSLITTDIQIHEFQTLAKQNIHTSI